MSDTSNVDTGTATGETETTQGSDPAAILNAGNLKAPLFKNLEAKFSFKKADEMGVKRAPVTVTLPVPTFEGLITALEDPEVANYILDLLADETKNAAKWQINDDQKPVNSQAELDVSKLTLAYIAKLPKAERTGGGISKETWASFAEDYIAVIPGVSGRSAEGTGKAAALLLAKLQPVKTNKSALKFLSESLDLWLTNTTAEKQEEFADCYSFLKGKAETFLNTDQAAILDNLQ